VHDAETDPLDFLIDITLHPSVMFKRLAPNALVALLGAAVFASGTSLAAQSPERLFYYVDNENSYDSFVKHVDQIDVLGPQVYTVDSLGTIWGGLDPRVKKLAAEHHVKVMPLVVNEGFNQPALRKLLADTAARGRATRTMAKLC
jgi:hypothetical protein